MADKTNHSSNGNVHVEVHKTSLVDPADANASTELMKAVDPSNDPSPDSSIDPSNAPSPDRDPLPERSVDPPAEADGSHDFPHGLSVSRFSTNDGETSGTICVPPASGDPAQGRAAGGDPALDGEELAVGTELDQYIIREMIGRGGCGTVYAAEHGVHATQVAIKVLRRSLASSSNQVRRFVQEAMALRLIDHPGIVRVYDTGYLHDGRPYFVMELLEGRSLASMLGERGRISPAESLEILGPVCEMLQLAHEAGIVHRDIKASNIMVTGGPEDRTIKLLDFGLAKLVNTEQSASMQTSVGVVLGTLHSMSPEQIMGGTVDERTDIYALGALLHRLLTGRHPFEDIDGQRVARMHLNAPPPQPSQLAPVSLALDAVVRRSMDKDPSLRFPSADAFLAALRDAVGSRSADTRRPGEAVAIYVEGRVAAGLDMDDQLFAVLMQALDRAEGVFARSGFQVL